VNEENVHHMELLKVSGILVRGGELVARGPSAREHQPAARTTAAPAHLDPDRGHTCSTRQQLRLFMMDSVDVDHHPCTSKQVWIVRFARREQGWGRVQGDAAKAAAGERFEVGFEGGPHPDGER